MNENELQSMQGQIAAMSMALGALMQSLQGLPAAQAALNLKMALEEAKQMDEEDETPPREAAARDSIAESYCELLLSVSRNA